MAEDIIHVAEDDPRRCQAVTGIGQCNIQAVEGSKFCKMHGGTTAQVKIKQIELNNYRLTQFKSRFGELVDNPKIKTLREEIAILRVVLEQIINQCNGPTELLIHSHKIADLVTRIEKIVTSCDRLERSMGMYLDKSSALTLAGRIVEVITQHVHDPDTLDLITEGILGVFKEVGK